MNHAAALRIAALATLATVSACGSRDGDAHFDGGTPSPLGDGLRIKQVTDPSLPDHPASTSNVDITGAAVLWIDTYDETHDGKSRGTVYLEDADGTSAPWSGISLYKPTFNPANLKVAPGDVLDLTGQYQENNKIGTSVTFGAGQVLAQMFQPQVRFRYEGPEPVARVIPASALGNYVTGRPYIGMLVTVENITFPGELVDNGSGRNVASLTNDISSNGPTVTNELYDLKSWNAVNQGFKKGGHVKSITGVVTFFFNLHVAPRRAEDIVIE